MIYIYIYIYIYYANNQNVDEKEDMEAYQKQVEDRKLQEQGTHNLWL